MPTVKNGKTENTDPVGTALTRAMYDAAEYADGGLDEVRVLEIALVAQATQLVHIRQELSSISETLKDIAGSLNAFGSIRVHLNTP